MHFGQEAHCHAYCFVLDHIANCFESVFLAYIVHNVFELEVGQLDWSFGLVNGSYLARVNICAFLVLVGPSNPQTYLFVLNT